MADPDQLRKLAVWYREFAERAGNPAIWEARLRTAEDLKLKPSVSNLNLPPPDLKQERPRPRARCPMSESEPFASEPVRSGSRKASRKAGLWLIGCRPKRKLDATGSPASPTMANPRAYCHPDRSSPDVAVRGRTGTETWPAGLSQPGESGCR